MTAAVLTTAGPADLDVLSEVIAEAFFGLPPSHWLIADPQARREVFPPYFRLILTGVMAAGMVQTNADRTAVALWLPVSGGHDAEPGSSEPGSSEPGSAEAEYAAELAAITGPWADRFRLFDATLAASHPPGPAHHYLALIGVRPPFQGQGAGSDLLRAYHQGLDCEAPGQPAYLEAVSLRTRQIYLRHGYADLGPPIQLPDGGPQMFPMWRDPAGPPA